MIRLRLLLRNFRVRCILVHVSRVVRVVRVTCRVPDSLRCCWFRLTTRSYRRLWGVGRVFYLLFTKRFSISMNITKHTLFKLYVFGSKAAMLSTLALREYPCDIFTNYRKKLMYTQYLHVDFHRPDNRRHGSASVVCWVREVGYKAEELKRL